MPSSTLKLAAPLHVPLTATDASFCNLRGGDIKADTVVGLDNLRGVTQPHYSEKQLYNISV